MIKENFIDIHISYRNITYYKNLGYSPEIDQIITIKPEHLAPVSHQKITAVCELCGNETVLRYYKYLENKNRHNFYSCKKCSNIKREKTSLQKFGVTNYAKTEECKEKISKNNMQKYGVKTTLLEKSTKEKIDKKIYELYGVKNILSSKEIKEKSKKTMLKKYGSEHYSKTLDFYNKTYNRWEKDALKKLKRYNIKDFILKKDRTIDIKCDSGFDHYFNITSKNLYQRKELQNNILCTVCNSLISQKQSGKELQIVNFIKENYNGSIIENDKKIISELDIYLPNLNLGIEFNGIFWHSNIYKKKYYHLNKTEKCEEKNINLIHIYEYDWIYKQDIVKSMILNKLGIIYNKIYARQTEIKEINDNKLIKNFLENNHIQGFVGSKIKIGLFYKNELISLMIFKENKKILTKRNNYKLLRFCNKLNTSIIGGESKLLNYFIKKYEPSEILTYVDRSWSKGNLYSKLGFDLIGKTKPNYTYYDLKCNKYNRFNLRKNVIIKKHYNPNKSKFEIIKDLGYLKVYNSGNLKFLYKPI